MNEDLDITGEYCRKFTELMREAKASGFSIVTILQYDDPLADTEWHTVLAEGAGPVLQLGMIEAGREMAIMRARGDFRGDLL